MDQRHKHRRQRNHRDPDRPFDWDDGSRDRSDVRPRLESDRYANEGRRFDLDRSIESRGWGERNQEGWRRGRIGGGGYGSQYGGWVSGATFGFGPEEDPRFGPRQPRRPGGSYRAGPSGRFVGSARENYSGRGPKDYRRTDERIREEVCDRLTDDPDVDASDITVNAGQGEVTLNGTVAARVQKRYAEECAEGVSGVRDVINQLRVKRAE